MLRLKLKMDLVGILLLKLLATVIDKQVSFLSDLLSIVTIY